MVTMTTIHSSSAFCQLLKKYVIKNTKFQMFHNTTIFNFKILNFVSQISPSFLLNFENKVFMKTDFREGQVEQ